MVNSITFDLHGSHNYILAKAYKDVLKKGKSKKKYDEAVQIYEEGQKVSFMKRTPAQTRYLSKNDIYTDFYKTVEDGYQNPHLIKNLKDRTIEFSKDKINLIFGPNASGKTTIIKAIAANAMCGSSLHFDGFTNPTVFKPTDLDPSFRHSIGYAYEEDENNTYQLVNESAYDMYMERIKDSIDKKAGNGATIDWDGSLVFYENSAGRKNYGDIGADFEGSIMGSLGDALSFYMNSHKISMGQRTMWLFKKVMDVIKSGASTSKFIEATLEKINHVNIAWYNSGKMQIEYLNKIYKARDSKEEIVTFLFDEIDKSLDITNVINLYKEILPEINRKFPIQIIMISHNPIVLSSLLSSDDYNIISIDEDYTKEVKAALSGVSY